MLKIQYAKHTYDPNVKILMGQSFGSWTHGHGPMALGAWAAAAGPPPPGKDQFLVRCSPKAAPRSATPWF